MRRLLIVDPCRQTRTLLEPFLKEQGYDLTFVPDAGAALAALWEGAYGAVLVDTTDPAAGGEALLTALKGSDPSRSQAVIPFVGLADEDARKRMEREGCPVAFPKPLDFHVMTSVLADLVPEDEGVAGKP